MDNERLNILKLLLETREKVFSIRQIALQRKVNYKSAYNAVKALEKQGLVALEKHGNASICSFSGAFDESVYAVERERLNGLLKNKEFLVLYNRLSKINAQFILLLFGSYAKKQQSKQSDIDLLLVSDYPQQIENQINLLPMKIHLTSVKYGNFIAMLKSREFTVVSEAVEHNVILFGTEDYYRLVGNAK